MSLLALLAALLAQHAFPPRLRQTLAAFYGRLCVSVAKRLNAGDRNSGILAWMATMALVLVPVALVSALLVALHPALLWMVEVVVIYMTLQFLSTTSEVAAIEADLRNGNLASAANRLAQWQGEPVNADDAATVSKLAAEQALREAHHGTFGPLLWFLVLPGPIGLVVYPLARRAALTWENFVEPEDRDFGWFAARAFFVIDWVPQRVTAFVFALVGDFEDALFCWRSQATQWVRPEEGIVLASGAGALGIRLGEPVAAAGGLVDRPVLGVGEPAREDALASLGGLLWRALIVWLIAYALAAALGAG